MSYGAVSVCSVLRNQQYGTSKKRTRKFSDLYVRPLQKSAKVASITFNGSYGKGVTSVDLKMTTN